MEDNIFDKVHEVDLKKTMVTSYIDYAMSVIAARALPDVRDGLKPVQRRILYSMIELNNGPDKPHRKCARIVGDTMGKYHPHGDSSIYGALVNLAQEWSTRYPLVDGHGNFGSVDGDGAAAMRYTEARLSKISMEMTADINKDTVDFVPNFDETEKEPVVLPSRFPNLLVNGTSGIAVGMATNIPPHNLREVINAVVKIIDDQIDENGETSMEDILQIIKGPDFPTGAEILGTRGIEEAYRTGRGKIRVRAVTNIEPMQNGKNRIIVTELPFMVNKARLIEKIAELIKAGFAPDDIYKTLLEYKDKTHLYFSLASLNNFAKNGRISPVIAAGIGLLGVRVVGKASDEGTLLPLDKCRGEKRALKKLIDHLKECGYTDGKIIIAHNNNEAGALELKKLIENTFGIFNGTIQKTRALCSYYAEPGSLLIGFEASLCNHKPYKD